MVSAFDPNEIAIAVTRKVLHDPPPLTPQNVKELVVPTLLPENLYKSIESTVDVWASRGPEAALETLKAQATTTGQAFELDLLRIAIMSSTSLPTDAELAALDRAMANWHLGAKELIARGHPDGARDLLVRLMPMAPLVLKVRGADAERSLAAIVSVLALSLQDLSQYERAVAVYEIALSVLDPARPDHRSERATILSNLGCLHHEQGRFELSTQALDDAIELFRELLPGSAAGLAGALANRGQSELYRGRTTSAERYFREAVEIATTHNVVTSPEAIQASILLLSHYLELQRVDQAIPVLRGAWRALCKARQSAFKAEIIALAAQGALRADDTVRAIRLFSIAVERFRALAPDHAEGRVDASRSLARAMNIAGCTSDAAEVARATLDDGENALGANHIENAKTRRVLSGICWDQGEYEEGESHIRAVIERFADYVPIDHPTRLACDGELAEFLLARHADDEAIDVLASCLEREGASLRRLIDERADIADATAMRMASEHLSLLILVALRAAPLSAERLRHIVDLRLRFGGSAAAIIASVRRGEPSPTSLLDAVVAPADDSHSETVLLSASSLYLSEGILRRAVMLADAKTARLIDLGPCGGLEASFERWEADPARAPGHALRHFVTSLTSAFGEHSRLIWLPDERLVRYPIAALPINNRRRLIDAVAILQPKDAYSLLARRGAAEAPPLLVGVSEFEDASEPDGLEPLPGVLDEIHRLRFLYGEHCRTFIDGEAQPEAVLSAMASGPLLAHIATHGLTSTGSKPVGRGTALRRQFAASSAHDPLARCALVLARNGAGTCLVTARSFAQLELGRTCLVVLSACDSGRGLADAAEGVLGFQSALHHAGVATVITSLWPLHDEVVPQIMEALHRDLLAGTRPSIALRNAQREAAIVSDPQAWGGMTVSGSDEPLVGKHTGQ